MLQIQGFVIFWIAVFKICGFATQLLDVLHDNIYESSPVAECVHDVNNHPIIDLDGNNEYATCYTDVEKSRARGHPDQDLRVNQVVLKYGYNLVTYNNITTDDGYILTVFRITGSYFSPPQNGKPAVLLFHGFGTASDEWLLQSNAQHNLPFILANAGYEVWLANARGTDFSQGHVRLNSDSDLKYWDFSFHEMGIYDFPAILNVMLLETGNEKIFFIGHSLGGAVFTAALSERPELNEKIHASILLAPAVFVGHAYHPGRKLSGLLEYGPRVQRLLNSVLHGRMTGSVTQLANVFQLQHCAPTADKCGVCENVQFYLYGYDAPQISQESVPNIMSKISNTQSVKTFIHSGQNFRSCEFLKYDYGIKMNLRKYGQTEPPSYNLTNVKSPLYIYYGDGDNLVPPEDAALLRDSLPKETVKGFYHVNWKHFNHIDFVLAKDADKLLYFEILDIITEHVKFDE